jgi:tetraacyldisaccharide 4'-kinase
VLTPSAFHDIVSGNRRGLAGSMWRGALRLASIPYGAAMWGRNRWYDANPRAVQRIEAPVISVGNLTLGGTGKTPFVAWLARWFRQQNIRVSLVSRGYGAVEHGRNDEARELELLLPDVPHLQNPDRYASARIAVDELAAQLVILDDGFQHRRLDRDLDIVLIDATEHDGWGYMFPRGKLRESPRELGRAQAIVLTRSDQCSEERIATIRQWASHWAPHASWTNFVHRPETLVDCREQLQPLENLRGRPVLAFCGIGNPASFRRTLEQTECQVVAWREFPDHHSYTREDIESLKAWAAGFQEPALVVCTQKDLVKIGLQFLGPRALFALRVAMSPVSSTSQLEQQLQAILAQIPNDPWDC